MSIVTLSFPVKRLLLVITAFIGLYSLYGCDMQNEPVQEETEILRPVKYITVEAAANGRTRTLSGTSKAGSEANLSFKVGGTINEIVAKVGGRLEPGDLIARLDRTSFELQVEKSRASLALAEAEKRNADANNRRVRDLYENNNVSREDLDSARTSAESAHAQVRSAQKSLELAILELGYTELNATAACSVAEVFTETNENVQAGESVVSLNCGEINEVSVPVPESLIASITQGLNARIRFDSISGIDFTGEVTEVGVTSTGGATYPVTLVVNETNDQLRSGLAAEVTFEFTENSSSDPNQLYLPPVAVGQDTKGRFVFIVDATDSPEVAVIRRQDVEIGELTSLGLEIKNGINLGDKVVTAGMSVIRDGLRVKAAE